MKLHSAGGLAGALAQVGWLVPFFSMAEAEKISGGKRKTKS